MRPAAIVLSTVLLLSGCSDKEGVTDAGCRAPDLPTRAAGRLTLATGAVTRAPWVAGTQVAGRSADPHEGKGYDAAFGYALAGRLGFEPDQVDWLAVPFPEAVRSGAKSFDIDINQATISDERRGQVDLSEPYYVMRQAVVSLRDRPVAAARDVDDLRDVSVATVAGTMAAAAWQTAVRPSTPAREYPDLTAVRRAVSENTHPALVTDFTTALQLDQDEQQLVGGTLVGLLPRYDEGAETYGLVLQKGSPLTSCVNAVLAAMREDGTLEELERTWLVEAPGYRELR